MSQNTSLENNKDSNSSDNDSSFTLSSASDDEEYDEYDLMEYEYLKKEAEKYCNGCKKKNKYCWCVFDKKEWNKILKRFTGYDYYCLECLECDKRYYEEEIKEYKKKITKEKDKNQINEYKKWIEEWEKRLSYTCNEVDIAKKYLITGELYEYHCVNCEYVNYCRPLKIVSWFCEVCDKKNYLFEGEEFNEKGYYYYNEKGEKKYTKYYESLGKMLKRKYATKHYFDNDDKYFYTDGIKFNHPHDPHNCIDCNLGLSEIACTVCNVKLRRYRNRYNNNIIIK